MKHIAIITKNHTNPAYGGGLIGAHTVARRFGYQIRHFAPSLPDDVGEQGDLLMEAIAGKPDAIVLLPAHASGVNGQIRAVNEAGIPLFLFVSKPTAGDWISFVGSDDERMAFALGMALLRTLPADTEVAIVDGHPGSITTPQRRRGFMQALERFPGLRLVGVLSGHYQQATGREAGQRLLQNHPRLGAFLVANDLMAMGVLQALEDTGRQAKLASINGTPDAIREVRAGRLVATASFNTYAFGCLIIEAASRHLRGEPVPHHIDLPADIIDHDNAADWDKPYEERACPDWESAVSAHGR